MFFVYSPYLYFIYILNSNLTKGERKACEKLKGINILLKKSKLRAMQVLLKEKKK